MREGLTAGKMAAFGHAPVHSVSWASNMRTDLGFACSTGALCDTPRHHARRQVVSSVT